MPTYNPRTKCIKIFHKKHKKAHNIKTTDDDRLTADYTGRSYNTIFRKRDAQLVMFRQ
jgi:hypothetical protein